MVNKFKLNMIYEEKRISEANSSIKQIYKESYLKFQNEKNIQKQTEITKSKEEIPLYKENNKQGFKKKDDLTDQLLDIKFVKEIFSKNNTKFLECFEFLEPIKAGSAGAVYRAKTKINNNKNKEKLVACKILPNIIKEKTQKFLIQKHKEVMIHKRFHHKNIPEIYGFYPVGEDYSCMVMEFNKYGDLDSFKRKVIKRACLSETLICYLAGGIIEALLYLNKKKTIHMDIKQQNVLIDDFLNVKVTDYSVSLFFGNEKEFIELPMVGTCCYMSPEVLERKRILISEASKIDIYSFGVLLYLLAFNDYPYDLYKIDSKDYKGILKNIKEKDLVFPEDTGHSEKFKNFIKKCLEKNIKNRYNIYQAMNDPWMKGYQIILNEKENLYNAGKFMIEIMVDNIKAFNDYMKN